MSDMGRVSLYSDFNALAELRSDAKQDKDGNIEEVAKQFESLFLNMMLKEGSKSSLDSDFMDNDQTRMYKGMLNQQLALELAGKGGVGIADMVMRSLKK